MPSRSDPQALIPLTAPVFNILLTLSEGEMHGYAIIREVDRRTGGQVRLGSGTLYAALRRMLEAGLVEESEERPARESDDERRRYYRMTPFGLEVASAEAERMWKLVRQASERNLLSGPLPSGLSEGD